MSLKERIAKLEHASFSGEMSAKQIAEASAQLLADINAIHGAGLYVERTEDEEAKAKVGLLAQLKQLAQGNQHGYS
jgi:hypothetical protein